MDIEIDGALEDAGHAQDAKTGAVAGSVGV